MPCTPPTLHAACCCCCCCCLMRRFRSQLVFLRKGQGHKNCRRDRCCRCFCPRGVILPLPQHNDHHRHPPMITRLPDLIGASRERRGWWCGEPSKIRARCRPTHSGSMETYGVGGKHPASMVVVLWYRCWCHLSCLRFVSEAGVVVVLLRLWCGRGDSGVDNIRYYCCSR